MTPWSKIELRRTAAKMPAGSPMISANRIAQSASSIVAGKSAANSRDHRFARDDGLAEVAVEEAGDVDAVLHEDRPVEAELLAQRLVPDGVDPALARHGLDRIAGDEPDQEEGEQRDPDEGRNDEADPGQDEAEHRGMIMRRTGAGPQSWNRRPTVRARRRRGMPPRRGAGTRYLISTP